MDLKDITFTIPVRIESTDRLNNLNYIVEFLLHNFDTNIIVYENGPAQVYENKRQIKHIFEQNNNALFHRTKYLNHMARLATTNYIANYDCDVFFPVKQIVRAYQILVNNETDGIFPYDGLFVNVPKNVPPLTYNVDGLNPNDYSNFGKNSMGGAIFWNKKVFMDGGMENEHFVSWGCEDWERLNRFTKLGYRIGRVKGPLYHITHSRNQNSSEENPHYQNNEVEFHKVNNMTKEQLQAYIKTWPWLFQ